MSRTFVLLTNPLPKLAVILFSFSWFHARPLHAGALDQVHDDFGGFATNGSVSAQTFTIGRDGILTRIEVPLRTTLENRTVPQSLELRLLRAAGGVPSGQPGDVLSLSTVQIPGAQFETYPTFFHRDFQWVPLELNVSVQEGEQYAVAVGPLNSPAHVYRPELAFDWIATFSPPGYTRGAVWGLDARTAPDFIPLSADIQDFDFRTYVVPEPAASLLTLTAILSAVALRRRLW